MKCIICSKSRNKRNKKYCSVECSLKGNEILTKTKEFSDKISKLANKRLDRELGKIIAKNVICYSCKIKFVINEREKKLTKEKVFCSTSCANKRKHSKETINKIKASLYREPEKRECKKCKKLFDIGRKKNQKFCGNSCASLYFWGNPENRKKQSKLMRENLENMSTIKRSKNEIHFYNMCNSKFDNVTNNKSIFNGWDADVILNDQKIAVLWNGKWHYEKITEKHSVSQVQTRDKIKIKEIKDCGYIPYVIKDMGRENIKFVTKEFNKFIDKFKL